MNYDEIDIAIIRTLHENDNFTTSDIAKKIFECKDSRELMKHDALIRHRMKKLVESRLVLCSNTKPKTYNSNPETVFTGTGTFEIKVNGDKTLEYDFGVFLVMADGDDAVYFHRIKGEEDIRVMT